MSGFAAFVAYAPTQMYALVRVPTFALRSGSAGNGIPGGAE